MIVSIDSLPKGHRMWKIYIIGIMYAIILFNVPDIRGELTAQLQIYKPTVDQKIIEWGTLYDSTLSTILKNQTIINGRVIDNLTKETVDTSDTWSLTHKPSITAEQFDAILQEYQSPAVGVGSHVTSYAASKNIDNAYALYIFIHESTAGTNSGWVGMKGNTTTHNPGNVICVKGYNCYKGFADLPDWESGFDLLINLLVDYRNGAGQLYTGKVHKTIGEAIHTWAPVSDGNNPDQYEAHLKSTVSKWRLANRVKPAVSSTNNVKPVTDKMQISANFTDKNCEAWGNQPDCMHFGTDILVCADCPVYAPVDCTYITTDRYDDPQKLGEYFMCLTTDGCELYEGHLKDAIRISPGGFITAGTIIGFGNSAVVGPHTHIQLKCDGQLVNFMDYYNKRKGQ